ncbi:general substrate transporter [Tothia fuscella]|uniref:General substrate transporter n=1 Tax=Tothia fuscella TaxID=1048955 RepID=A0A9P4TVA3_9PEZI|nr:general substrate transporter [Tothia fuscella]
MVALQQEHDLTHQSRSFYWALTMISLAAILQGWGQTGINTANIQWAKAMGLDPEHSSGDIWKVGAVNSACYFFAAGIGCWLSPTLNNLWGRRGVILFGAIFSFASVLASSWTTTWQGTFACRAVLGLGMGSKAATVPIYAAEISPSKARGSFVIAWQTWVAFGIFLGFSSSLIVYQRDDAFRLELGSAFIPAVPLMFGIFFAPESPRYLVKIGDYQRAYRSLLRLRKRPVIAFRDLIVLHEQLKLERELLATGGLMSDNGNPVITWLVRFKELWTIRRTRRATWACITVMLAQQMCGINVTAFYSSWIFLSAGGSIRTALLAGWGFGLINFLCAFVAVRNIDKYGRLLSYTFPAMAICLMCTALAFKIEGKGRVAVLALFMYLHDAFYSVGEGPVPFTYSAESFDLTHREIGMSLSVSVNLFFAGLLALVFPQMILKMRPGGALGFFAGTSLLAWVMIWFLMPETKQRSLEQLSTKFDVPLKEFASKRLQRITPWVHWQSSISHDTNCDFDVELEDLDGNNVAGIGAGKV